MGHIRGLFSLILSAAMFCSITLEARVKKTINKKNFKESSVTYDRLQNMEITPPVGPSTKEGVGVALDFEYIYWYMSEDGLNFAASDFQNQLGKTVVGSNSIAPSTEAYYVGKGGSSGFKAGVGVDFDYDGWDIGVLYTRYKHQDNQKPYSPSGAFVPLTYALAEYVETPFGFSSHFSLMLNILDVELARAFYLSPKLTIRPFLGGKGSWGHQYFNIDSYIPHSDYPLEDLDYTAFMKSHYKQASFGFGTRAGFDIAWLLSSRFSLIGKCAITGLWQYFSSNREDDFDALDLATQANFLVNYQDLNFSYRYHTVNPVFETQIGMRYDYLFSEDEYRVRVQLAWENQVWFCQNAFLTYFGANQAKGNLRLQGLTASLRIDF